MPFGYSGDNKKGQPMKETEAIKLQELYTEKLDAAIKRKAREMIQLEQALQYQTNEGPFEKVTQEWQPLTQEWQLQKPTMPEETERTGGISKQQFWEEVIEISPVIRRYVGKRELLTREQIVQLGGYEQQKKKLTEEITGMFIPLGPDDDFNLVYSLCTDGMHRPVFDLDYPKEQLTFGGNNKLYIVEGGSRHEFKTPGNLIVVDSTTHCHAYCQTPVFFTEYLEYLAELPGEDAQKFRHNVERMGYGGLRPPWIVKKEGE